MASASNIRAGGAFVQLFTVDKMSAGLRAAAAKLRAFAAGVSAVGQRMFAIGAIAGAGLLAAGKHFADLGSDMLDMSQRTGVAVEALSELRFAAEQSGSSAEELENALKFMQKGGFGRGADDLERIADELAGMSDPAMRTARAIEIFGRAGTRLLPMLIDGRAGVQRLREEARRLGISMSTEDAVAAESFGDALSTMTTVLKRAVFNIGGALSPALHDAATLFTDSAAAVGKWIKENSSLVRLVGAAVIGFTGMGLALMVLGPALRVVAFGISAIALSFTVLKAVAMATWVVITSPILLITAGIVGIGAAIVATSTRGRELLGALGVAFTEVGVVAAQTWEGIADAIASGNWGLAFRIALAGTRVAWAGFVSNMRGSWANFTGMFVEAWHTAISWVAQGLLTFVRTTIQAIGRAMQAITSLAELAGIEIGNPLEPAVAEIEAIQGTMAEDDAEAKRQRERQRALAGATDPAAAAELADLRAQLTALTNQARDERLWTEALRPGGAGAAPPSTLQEIGKDIEAKGTFSAFAVGGLGASSLTKTESLLREIATNTRDNAQPAFT